MKTSSRLLSLPKFLAGLLVCTLSTAVGSVAQTPPPPPSEVVVARFFVDIDGLESDFPEEAKAKGLVPLVVHGTQTVRTAKDVVETLRNPDGSPVKGAFDSMYAVVEAEMSALGLRLLPADTLREAVPFLLGYPVGTAKSVVRDGLYPRALEVEIDVTVPDQGTGYFAVIGTGRATTKGRPEMVLRMRYVDVDGTEWREKVRVRSKEKVALTEKWILGIRAETTVPEASTLPVLTRQAVEALIRKRTSS